MSTDVPGPPTDAREQGTLEHRGLLHDPDDLAAAVVPEVRAALDAGDAVVLLVDRRTAREVRDALGPAGGAVELGVPTEVFRRGASEGLRRLRARVGAGRRTLIVGQYGALTATPDDHTVIEEGIDLVLADLPLTVLCACARDADPGAVVRLRRHHRRVAGAEPSPDDHVPATDRSPVPGGVWGAPALRATFGGLDELRDLRTRVADVTAAAGLDGECADAALLAVHEAAVLACSLRGDAPDDCVLEIHTAPGSMLTEIRAPGRAPIEGTDPLRILRLLSREATMAPGDPGRRIRVLSAASVSGP